ncbi:exodeoxyribonuclease VII small subunit [Auraticoccus monumenti]|uniref:Exodeoxyribonuclease 7 small subunit n=1 Tax=Auraticoccus monumenti TaxID=675864 RepID=A0A1G6ZYP8_9ACTN|nr:exodeoxyribonuclease VII small subunit [Auraticoccus monumenti]SDE06756.1 Exodeoxyribonuclease VII small subunit [Auraticoccus monumenti]
MSTPDPSTEDELKALEELGYEEARDQLAEVVRALESGGSALAESLTLWQRGEKLAQVCQARLDGARALVESARADDATTG